MTCITKLRMPKGTKHAELYLTPSDSSQIPAYLISRLATKQRDSEPVGAGGGDELFGEYNSYILTTRIGSQSDSFLRVFVRPPRQSCGEFRRHALIVDFDRFDHLAGNCVRQIPEIKPTHSRVSYWQKVRKLFTMAIFPTGRLRRKLF